MGRLTFLHSIPSHSMQLHRKLHIHFTAHAATSRQQEKAKFHRFFSVTGTLPTQTYWQLYHHRCDQIRGHHRLVSMVDHAGRPILLLESFQHSCSNLYLWITYLVFSTRVYGASFGKSYYALGATAKVTAFGRARQLQATDTPLAATRCRSQVPPVAHR